MISAYAAIIRTGLKDNGQTVADMAKALKKSYGYCRLLHAGKKTPSKKFNKQIARYFKLDNATLWKIATAEKAKTAAPRVTAAMPPAPKPKVVVASRKAVRPYRQRRASPVQVAASLPPEVRRMVGHVMSSLMDAVGKAVQGSEAVLADNKSLKAENKQLQEGNKQLRMENMKLRNLMNDDIEAQTP